MPAYLFIILADARNGGGAEQKLTLFFAFRDFHNLDLGIRIAPAHRPVYLRPGSQVVLGIDGLGEQRQRVVADEEPG